MASIDAHKYSHSPIHKAVLERDHAALKLELSSLPRLSDPSEIRTEAQSASEEEIADAISAIVDRRDVPNRETPLHLAVRLSDPTAVEMLMAAGAEWSLQNQQGWSALQEAICAKEENLAKIIVRHYQPLAWAKWHRRLPRVIGSMRRMRDFYMEITFHFESSVIPFISRVAPSDTYKIWKRGPNLRADMTLAGFDGFRIQRADQSILFLGEGSEDGKVRPGSLCVVSHKNKEVMNALEGAGAQASEASIQHEVSAMTKAGILRPGIDVTKAVLLPQMTWRRQERRDTVGSWKAKVYDMHHVVVSMKTRHVPGASTKGDASSCNEEDIESEEFTDILTEEERKQLEAALKMESPDLIDEDISGGYVGPRHSCYEQRRITIENASCCGDVQLTQDKGKTDHNHDHDEERKIAPSRRSLCVNEKASDLLGDSPQQFQRKPGEDLKAARNMDSRKSDASLGNVNQPKPFCRDNEYKKGLRPSLWLSPNFPLQTEELLPLLDILANKVKAIRRLRELLTSKLPPGTFPVKVSIPLVPTIRVLVTFTKFEELQHQSEEFSTPPSSPPRKPSTGWRHWLKVPSHRSYPPTLGLTSCAEDPFVIPPDYVWITPEAKKRRMWAKKRKSSK